MTYTAALVLLIISVYFLHLFSEVRLVEKHKFHSTEVHPVSCLNSSTMSKTITKTATWSCGLLDSMRNPQLIVISNDIAVVIKDKYPKAKYHFLILPRENIPSIYHVSPT